MAKELYLSFPDRKGKLLINECIMDGNNWKCTDFAATVLDNTSNILSFINDYRAEPYGRHILTMANGNSIYFKAVAAATAGFYNLYAYLVKSNGEATRSDSLLFFDNRFRYFFYMQANIARDTFTIKTGTFYTDTVGHITVEAFDSSFMTNYDDIPLVMGGAGNPYGRDGMTLDWLNTPRKGGEHLVSYGTIWGISYSSFIEGATEAIDPYGPIGGNSTPGGNGSFNFASDGFSFPSNPSLSSANSGFTTVYMPTRAQLIELHDYLWNTDMATYLRKFFESTADAIVSLQVMPVQASTANKELKYGLIGSGVTLPAITTYYSQVTFSLDMDKCFDSALDYEPYTTMELILPYYGSIQVEPEYIQGQSINITYVIEIATGDCTIYVYTGISPNIKIINTLTCNVATSIMVTGGDKGIGQLTNLLMTTASTAAGISLGKAGFASMGDITAGANLGSQMIGSVVNSKPQLTHSGQIAGSMKHGHWGVPYLVIKRVHPVLPDNYNKLFGYACNYTSKLSSCSGYTSCQIVHVSDVPEYCTELEREEIESLLIGGVIL